MNNTYLSSNEEIDYIVNNKEKILQDFSNNESIIKIYDILKKNNNELQPSYITIIIKNILILASKNIHLFVKYNNALNNDNKYINGYNLLLKIIMKNKFHLYSDFEYIVSTFPINYNDPKLLYNVQKKDEMIKLIKNGADVNKSIDGIKLLSLEVLNLWKYNLVYTEKIDTYIEYGADINSIIEDICNYKLYGHPRKIKILNHLLDYGLNDSDRMTKYGMLSDLPIWAFMSDTPWENLPSELITSIESGDILRIDNIKMNYNTVITLLHYLLSKLQTDENSIHVKKIIDFIENKYELVKTNYDMNKFYYNIRW
jgi:hypothetical protein